MHHLLRRDVIEQLGYMALRVFASAWGNATHWGSLRRLMDGLQFKGFAGLEASLADLGKTPAARRDVAAQARDRDLELIVGLYSHWTDYEGTWAPASPAEHLDQLRRQVDACAALEPMHINVHAGCDSWPEDVSTRFFEDAQSIVPANASFETHRGARSDTPSSASGSWTPCPACASADPSHWHVVERSVNMDAVAGRVDHPCPRRQRGAPALTSHGAPTR